MKKYWLAIGLFSMVVISACKKWEDHNAVTEQNLNETLTEHISKMPNLSRFNEYLVKTGLDTMLRSSKNYTVFAPTNDALNTLPASVTGDAAQLKAYLLNVISGQAFFLRNAVDSFRVPMLNGKRVLFLNNKLDDASITQGDVYVKNGVLHVIDKVVPPLQSVWEFIQSTKATYTQNAYISTLNYTAQDPTKAVLDSINPATGLPVYKAGTGIVEINTFRTKVYDVANEDSLYTYVVLTNTAYTSEKTRVAPYVKAANADTADRNASWSVVKDLAIKGLYNADALPAALLSKFGVRIPMNKTAIVETRKLSNGIVYVVNAAAAPIEDKLPTVYIQGETPDALKSTDSKYLVKIFYRQRFNPLTSQPFKDIYLSLGSIGASFYVDYLTNSLYTTKYKVYWVALNDKVISGQADDPYGTDSTIQQILQIGPNTTTYTPTFSVQAGVKPYTYTETYIGDYTNDSYNWLLSYPLTTPDGNNYTVNPATKRIRLLAPAALTNIPYNMTLDYLKFVPVP